MARAEAAAVGWAAVLAAAWEAAAVEAAGDRPKAVLSSNLNGKGR